MFGHQCVKLLPVPRTTPLRRRSDGLADFDVAATRDSRPRTLTLDLHFVRRRPAAHHIEFQTWHGDNVTPWPIFEGDTGTTTPPELVPISAHVFEPKPVHIGGVTIAGMRRMLG
ncbi:hypothetical protein ACVWWN_002464 [Mycobacterium sp. URHB0021]|jgi:hypothetical protein